MTEYPAKNGGAEELSTETQANRAFSGFKGLDTSGEESVNGRELIGGPTTMALSATEPQPATTDPVSALTQALAPKVAVSYLRVSTTGQARRGGGDDEGFSIPAQRDANRRKAASMGAIVVKEFVDRGASARSANRPELQRMLEYLEEHDVDYVIVHKLDRLARNRADDVEITQALERSNVRLVSTTESIDQTTSGMLLHGIMSSIAEFYSRNLAAEVVKGMTQKARSGGTVGRAPLGYRNHRDVDAEGREVRTVILDPERAPLVTKAFELYATGDWTISKLADELNDRGLTTAPTPKVASKPITEGLLHKVLINPYYKGMVNFQGTTYDGRHEPLVDNATWERVQNVLATHVNGERTKKHPHYLKSTVFCGSCGERLMVQISTSKSGMKYPYFYCAGRHSRRTKCTMKAVLIYEVERKIEDHYERIQLDDTFREQVRQVLIEAFRDARADVEQEQAGLKREREKLERQREKLLEAHYANAIPLDLMSREQERISSTLAKIASKFEGIDSRFDTVEKNLDRALELATDCATAYREAPESVRRMFNQVFFERVLVFPDDDAPEGVRVDSELREPFTVLLGADLRLATATATMGRKTKKTANQMVDGLASSEFPQVLHVKGLSKELLVEVMGFEPMTPCMPCKCSAS